MSASDRLVSYLTILGRGSAKSRDQLRYLAHASEVMPVMQGNVPSSHDDQIVIVNGEDVVEGSTSMVRSGEGAGHASAAAVRARRW